jgi:hypothetical protein
MFAGVHRPECGRQSPSIKPATQGIVEKVAVSKVCIVYAITMLELC